LQKSVPSEGRRKVANTFFKVRVAICGAEQNFTAVYELGTILPVSNVLIVSTKPLSYSRPSSSSIITSEALFAISQALTNASLMSTRSRLFPISNSTSARSFTPPDRQCWYKVLTSCPSFRWIGCGIYSLSSHETIVLFSTAPIHACSVSCDKSTPPAAACAPTGLTGDIYMRERCGLENPALQRGTQKRTWYSIIPTQNNQLGVIRALSGRGLRSVRQL
jgi:hypothetical protein